MEILIDMLKLLSNPESPHYLGFKNWVLSGEFVWYYNEYGGVHSVKGIDSNVPFYTRTFIRRPETRAFPSIDSGMDSNQVDNVVKVITEIFEYNNLSFNSLLRLSVNAVHPKNEIITSTPHVDHNFPHQNFIIYLTDAGGSTFIEGEEHDPRENDVIYFTGEHYHKTPAKKRRVILVATMI